MPEDPHSRSWYNSDAQWRQAEDERVFRQQQEAQRKSQEDARIFLEQQEAQRKLQEGRRDYEESQRQKSISTYSQQNYSDSSACSCCFVATAVYGDKNHPDVTTLRFFRDNFLCQNVAGRCFVYSYYRVGSHLASLVLLLGIHESVRRCLVVLAAWLRAKYTIR